MVTQRMVVHQYGGETAGALLQVGQQLLRADLGAIVHARTSRFREMGLDVDHSRL
jgi:hypothetical protein